MNAPLCAPPNATLIASARSSTLSTLVTPLLPAESVGLTITGQLK